MSCKNHGIIKQAGSTLQEKPTYGTTFLYPMIIRLKNGSGKIVWDAKHPISNFNQSSEFWPLEPLAKQIARTFKQNKSTSYFIIAYALHMLH